jgi:hypothetical protein
MNVHQATVGLGRMVAWLAVGEPFIHVNTHHSQHTNTYKQTHMKGIHRNPYEFTPTRKKGEGLSK